MIRVAAMADVHCGEDSAGKLRPHYEHLPDQADLFLIAGDLTRRGLPEEALVLARELEEVAALVPTFAVLGNHDYHSDDQAMVAKVLDAAGVQVLEGESDIVEVDGRRVGVAGRSALRQRGVRWYARSNSSAVPILLRTPDLDSVE